MITEDPLPISVNPLIDVSMLRLDKIHPLISGNKWFKLRYYLEAAQAAGKKRIISFGGAYSNHLLATAAACRLSGLRSAGIVRGEQPQTLSPTLRDAIGLGMELFFVPRDGYREYKLPEQFQREEDFIIPEGGYGDAGARGAATLLEYADPGFTHCCCAVGTGTMMAGLIRAAPPSARVVGISVMKNNRELERAIQNLLPGKQDNWELLHDYHFGGYARHRPDLLHFMEELYRKTGIRLDFVYTAKLVFGVNDLLQRGFFPVGSRILVIHSGGLQGNRSLHGDDVIL